MHVISHTCVLYALQCKVKDTLGGHVNFVPSDYMWQHLCHMDTFIVLSKVTQEENVFCRIMKLKILHLQTRAIAVSDSYPHHCAL